MKNQENFTLIVDFKKKFVPIIQIYYLDINFLGRESRIFRISIII